MNNFKEEFIAMYREMWEVFAPKLWMDNLEDKHWNELIKGMNRVAEAHKPIYDYATDLSKTLMDAVVRRQDEIHGEKAD